MGAYINSRSRILGNDIAGLLSCPLPALTVFIYFILSQTADIFPHLDVLYINLILSSPSCGGFRGRKGYCFFALLHFLRLTLDIINIDILGEVPERLKAQET